MPAMSGDLQSADTMQSDELSAATAGTTPLYERPDGWSRVLQQLSPGAEVRPVGRQGAFIRVLASGGVTGYVATTAPLPAIVAFNAKGSS